MEKTMTPVGGLMSGAFGRSDLSGLTGGQCAARPPHDWETASERWAAARTEFYNAQRAADEAMERLDQARADEQAAWSSVVEASKREADVGALSRAFPEAPKPPACANKAPSRF